MAATKPAKKERKARTPVDPNETKAQKFVRLGTKRVNKAVKSVKQLAQLAGSGYDSTPEQRKKITDALDGAVKLVKDRFAGQKEAAAETITL